MTNRNGAPVRNSNAAGHGLYSSRPRRHVAIQAEPSLPDLAALAQDLTDSALWIAEQLTIVAETLDLHHASRQIGLYASVAQELAQLTGELLGEQGIKAASLGQLPEAQYEVMMAKQVQALELILNQCISAALYIRDREEILGEGGGLIMQFEEGIAINPALTYLAGHMRSCKRIIREMAANLAWKARGSDDGDDLTTRIYKQIGLSDG